MLEVTSFNSATFTGPAPCIGTGDFSVDVWVRSSASSGYFLDTRGPATSNVGWMAGVYGGHPLLQLNAGGASRFGRSHNYVAPCWIADDQWHHLAFSVDRDADVTIYLDGAESFSEQARYADVDLTGSFLTLGSAIDPTPFFGRLEGLDVVNHALRSVDVWDRFSAGSGRVGPAPVATGVG